MALDCRECQRLNEEFDRLEQRRDMAQAALETAALNETLAETLAAHETADEVKIELGLAQSELEAHLLLQHGNTMES